MVEENEGSTDTKAAGNSPRTLTELNRQAQTELPSRRQSSAERIRKEKTLEKWEQTLTAFNGDEELARAYFNYVVEPTTLIDFAHKSKELEGLQETLLQTAASRIISGVSSGNHDQVVNVLRAIMNASESRTREVAKRVSSASRF